MSNNSNNEGRRPIDAMAIAKEYFPGWDEDTLADVIWSETGWPCFWSYRPIEDCLRLQLAIVASREIFAEFGYFPYELILEREMAKYRKPSTEGQVPRG